MFALILVLLALLALFLLLIVVGDLVYSCLVERWRRQQ